MSAARLPYADAERANIRLRERYLAKLDIHQLSAITERERKGVLSGLFLPTVVDAYLDSQVRVMLIGQDPRRWGIGMHALATGERTSEALDTYVRAQMKSYSGAVAEERPGRHVFLQFRKQLSTALLPFLAPGSGAIQWGNLLCMSLNGLTATKASQLASIRILTAQLLAIQLEVLQPDLIVFASGLNYDKFFKDQIDNRFTTLEGFKPRELWPMKIESPPCLGWRVRHPRSLTQAIRAELIGALRASLLAIARAGAVAGETATGSGAFRSQHTAVLPARNDPANVVYL